MKHDKMGMQKPKPKQMKDDKIEMQKQKPKPKQMKHNFDA
jgi:hypothetical protein